MRIKLKDISIHKIKAVDSTDYPRLDDEVFDIMLGDKKVLRGVSGLDMGLSDLFCSWFQLEEDDCPTAKEMAEFRVGKVVELLEEAQRIAEELEVLMDIEVVFDNTRQHPHLKHRAEGDVIVNKYIVTDFPNFSKGKDG